MTHHNHWNEKKVLETTDNAVAVMQKLANVCEKITQMQVEYSKIESDKQQLALEAEKIAIMRNEILLKFQQERDKIVAQLLDRNEDRKYIQGVLNEAIKTNDRELKDLGFDLYKVFLEQNFISK
ncbi:hypothetical protein [Flavobacterium sp.]|uniref:hypothetical protein n=1 Tax=Flavobacterium sp. TaxID=239 RepID=UPI0039E331D2